MKHNNYKTNCKCIRLLVVFLFMELFNILPISGQKNASDNSLRKSLDYMFEHIHKSSVPTGLLRDYAVEDEDLDLYSGEVALNNDNLTTLARYGNLLSTISSASLEKKLSTNMEHSLKRYSLIEKENVLYLSFMLYQYARIKKNALTDNLILYKNGQVYDNNKKESPYQTAFAFAGCCLNGLTNKTDIPIKLPAPLSFTNCAINKIEIDYGTGFSTITYDKTIQAKLKKGINKLTLKATLKNGKMLFAHTIVEVVDNPIKTKHTISYGNYAEYTIQGKPYRGISTTAEMSIAYAPGNNSLKKPFVIVEGFDPRAFKDSPKGVWNFENNVIKDRNIFELRKKGYDIVYLDWVKPEEYIQANANTLIEAINRINMLKKQSGSSEKNVILGHSMGGLITRYALKTMENGGVKHQVSTYISYDAPHLGAHIPLGVLYGFHGILSFIESRGIIKPLLTNNPTISSYINLAKSMAYATSAQQMLVYFIDPAGNFNNQEHMRWQNEINALGFPKGDKGEGFSMLAVSNSNYAKPNMPSCYLKTDFTGGSDAISSIFPTFSGLAVGIGLNDIVSGLLTMLPGRTAIDGSFEIYPAKSTGDLITHISLKYKKKFLWLISISKNVFSYDRYFPGVGYLFDTYPSSPYALKRDSKGNPIWQGNSTGSVPLVYDYGYNIQVETSIPFIPTSSALAYGNGLNTSPSNYFKAPTGLSSPFGENYFTHMNAVTHAIFSDDGMKWIKSRLYTSIIGPKVGYNGAKYSLSSTTGGNITWDCDKKDVASINSAGVLTVKGRGVVVITANYKDQTYSQTIMVGLPRYVLSATHEPGGCKVNATCIDNEYKNYLPQLNGVLKFNWGIKYSNKDIRWFESDKSSFTVQPQEQNGDITIFLQIEDALGNKSALQHISVHPQDVYASDYTTFYIDSEGNLYDFKKRYDLYESSRVFIDYKPNLPEKYEGREWMPITAIVLSPQKGNKEISMYDGGPLVSDILSEEEYEFIRNKSNDNQRYNYMLMLLNDEQKVIQYIPICFIFKTTLQP